MASPSEPGGATADAALRIARSRPASLGHGRLICVDGPAGAGKTTLAHRLSARTGAPVVHMDDLYDGWQGLATGIAQLEELLSGLAADREAGYRRFDWHTMEYAERVTLRPPPLLVVEGVGSGARSHADRISALVWVTAPWRVRRQRSLARDGEAAEPLLRRWETTQNDHFLEDRTRRRADLTFSTADLG